jgi:hypothetical protein
MADELMNMSLEEAMPLSRALGHYLGLTSIAELHHRYEFKMHISEAGTAPLTALVRAGCVVPGQKPATPSHVMKCLPLWLQRELTQITYIRRLLTRWVTSSRQARHTVASAAVIELGHCYHDYPPCKSCSSQCLVLCNGRCSVWQGCS